MRFKIFSMIVVMLFIFYNDISFSCWSTNPAPLPSFWFYSINNCPNGANIRVSIYQYYFDYNTGTYYYSGISLNNRSIYDYNIQMAPQPPSMRDMMKKYNQIGYRVIFKCGDGSFCGIHYVYMNDFDRNNIVQIKVPKTCCQNPCGFSWIQ